MRYYKVVSDGYLMMIGTGGNGGEEITVQEYEQIEAVIRNMPAALEGCAYRLTEGLAWELYEVETPEIADMMTETEQKAAAFDILTGVSE